MANTEAEKTAPPPEISRPAPATGLLFECRSSSKLKYTTSTATALSSYTLFLDKSKTTHPNKPFRHINEAWHSGSKVIHSCNGLLLCSGKRTRRVCNPTTGKWYSTSKRARRVYSVCNPTTGDQLALPQVPVADSMKICGAYLAFDPRKSPHYKVVCVLGLAQAGCKFCRYCQFVVYSSETGCWGECGELFEANNVRFRKNNGVFWNGAIHWVGRSTELFSFNPDDDRLAPKVMPMPIARHHDQRYYFGESCGHLHYVCLEKGVREVVVHEMSSEDNGWAVKFKFDVSNAVRHPSYYFSNYFDDFNVCAVVRGERSEDTFLVLETRVWWRGCMKIVRFNHDNTFETIYDFQGSENPLKNPEEHYHPFQHIESLASV